MRITELFTAQSIALDEALQTQEQILSRLVELQATHGNITDKEAYKKALYAREAEASTSRRSSLRRSPTARCLYSTPRVAQQPRTTPPVRTASAAACTRT